MELIDHCRHPDSGGYTPSDFPDVQIDQDRLNRVVRRVSKQPGHSRA